MKNIKTQLKIKITGSLREIEKKRDGQKQIEALLIEK